MNRTFYCVLFVVLALPASILAQTVSLENFTNGAISFSYPSNYSITTPARESWKVIVGDQTDVKIGSPGNQFEISYIPIPSSVIVNPTKAAVSLQTLLAEQRDLIILAFGEKNVSEITSYTGEEHSGYIFSYYAQDKYGQSIFGAETIELFQGTILRFGIIVDNEDDIDTLDAVYSSISFSL